MNQKTKLIKLEKLQQNSRSFQISSSFLVHWITKKKLPRLNNTISELRTINPKRSEKKRAKQNELHKQVLEFREKENRRKMWWQSSETQQKKFGLESDHSHYHPQLHRNQMRRFRRRSTASPPWICLSISPASAPAVKWRRSLSGEEECENRRRSTWCEWVKVENESVVGADKLKLKTC